MATSALLTVELLPPATVVGLCEDMKLTGAHLVKHLHGLFSKLATFPPGDYLLRHAPGDDRILVYSSVRSQAATLPAALDLHALLAQAGSVDPALDAYVPPVWEGPDDHIPYTFPPAEEPEAAAATASPPSQAAPEGKVRGKYCYTFAKLGTCNNPKVGSVWRSHQ